MNLQEFTSPLPKPWLNINANNLSTQQIPTFPGATVSTVASVPNPALGNDTLWADMSDNLNMTDSTGDVVTFATTALVGTYLPLAGGTMSGDIAMATHNITNIGSVSGATNSRTADNIVSNAGASTSGHMSSFSGATGKVITDSGVVAANVVTNSGAAVSGNVATFNGASGKIIQDSGASLSQYLPLAGGTMSGDIAMGTHNITNAGSISGAANTRTADNIVSCSGTAISGDLASFSGVSGKVVTDSGILFSNVVTNIGASTSGDVATFSDATGKIVTDSGIVSANLVSNSGAATSGHVATFSGATGKLITDSGATLSQYLPLSGGTMSGNINMGGGNITGIGTLTPTNSVYIGSSITDGGAANNNILIGNSVNGTGLVGGDHPAVSIGNASTVIDSGPIAIGYNATAGGTALGFCIAIGDNASATTLESISIGRNTVASTLNDSISIGRAATSTGGFNVAIGIAPNCSALDAVAIGRGITASGASGVALSHAATASNTNAIAIGDSSTASATNAVAISASSTASAANAIAIGQSANNSTANSCLIGNSAIVNIRANNTACDLGTSAANFKTCWLRDGQPAVGCKFSMYGSVNVAAPTTTETSMTTGSSVGSLVYSATQATGSVFRIKAGVSLTQAAAADITIRFKVGATTLISVTTGAGVLGPLAGELVIMAVVQASNIACSLNLAFTGIAATIISADPAFTPSSSSTFDVTGQFNNNTAGNSFTVNFLNMETLYAT